MAAPILLGVLHIVQGIAAGSEWGTSTAFIIEWSPPNRRGFFGSFQQVSTAGGLLLGSATAAILTSGLSSEQMLQWGWRLAFILGLVLLLIGVYIRRNVEETPSFEARRLSTSRSSPTPGWVPKRSASPSSGSSDFMLCWPRCPPSRNAMPA